MQTLAWLSQSIGGIVASIFGGICVDEGYGRLAYLLWALVTLFIFLSAYLMSIHLEEEHKTAVVVQD